MYYKKQGSLFLLSAPSGAGKTTLVTKVISIIDGVYPIKRVVTYTSREPRQGEIDKKDYCFVSKEEFVRLKDNAFFLESSNEYGAWYGTPHTICDDLDKGVSCIGIVDRIGARQIKSQLPSTLIWVYTKNRDELKNRLIARGQNTEEQIEDRLSLSEKEIAEELSEGLYEYHVLNDNFDQAVLNLKDIIIKTIKG